MLLIYILVVSKELFEENKSRMRQHPQREDMTDEQQIALHTCIHYHTEANTIHTHATLKHKSSKEEANHQQEIYN